MTAIIEIAELREVARQVVGDAGIAANGADLWGQIVQLGWLLVAVPETAGGLGSGAAGACCLHRELGRGLSRAPYLPAMMVIDSLAASSGTVQADWLERVLGGAPVAASLAEPAMELEGESLRGMLPAVQGFDEAGSVLVWNTARDLVALVPLSHAGVSASYRKTWDETRSLYDVSLSGVPVADLTVLAQGGQAESMIQRILVQRDLALSADSVGAADALLQMTVEYLGTRVQFRRPLAMFQALKHRCADMKAALEGASALLDSTLQRVDRGGVDADTASAAAGVKRLAVSMYAQVAEEALQLHGGIGMAIEHPCHLFLKRALLNEQLGSARADDEAQIVAVYL